MIVKVEACFDAKSENDWFIFGEVQSIKTHWSKDESFPVDCQILGCTKDLEKVNPILFIEMFRKSKDDNEMIGVLKDTRVYLVNNEGKTVEKIN